MKLTTLEYFVAVANELSFTKALEKLFISQPTLSRRIQELEEEVGVSLFVRQSHSLRLSGEGERFLIEATDVLTRVDHLSHLFDREQTAGKAPITLRIGYLANFNMGKMYELLNQFRQDYPNLQFVTKPDAPLNLVDGLINGDYDLVFNLSNYFYGSQKVEKAVFMKNRLQIAMPAEHPLGHRKSLSFADLSQETFILLERQQSPVIVDYMINQGLKNGFNLRANYYVKNLDEGLSMVSLGKGLAFLYSGMNDQNLEEKYHIRIVDIEDSNQQQDLVTAMNPDNDRQLVRNLFNFVK